MAIENLSLSAGQSALLAATKGGQPLVDGQVIEARVTAVLENGSVRLQTLLGLLEAVPQTPLKPGATLFLEVQRQGDSLRLVPTERPATAATGQGQGAAGAAPQAASGLDRPAVLTGAVVSTTARPAAPAPTTPGTASGTPAGTGGGEAGVVRGPTASPSGGTAPTSAGTGAPSTAGVTPGGSPAAAAAQPAGGAAVPAQGGAPQAASVSAPAGQSSAGGGTAPAAITGGQTPAATGAATAATPAGAPAAAATPAATPRVAAPAAEIASRPPLADTLKAAVQAAMRGDVARQGSMAALYADLSALVSGRGQRLPEPVMRAAAALLGFRLDSAEAPSGEALRSALARSGVFLEARLADGKAPAQGDLKASLGTLKSALLTFLGDMAEEGLATRGEATPPPRRGAAPLAQRAGAPTLPLDADGPAMARHLLGETEAALSRVRLAQMAALPDAGDTPTARSEPGLTQWTMELPVGLGAETMMAQFAISRDARGKSERKGPVWQVRFAMDLEPLGPVDALVTLAGEKVGVTLWAERPESAEKLSRGIDELKQALTGEAFEIEEVRCRPGRQGAAERAGYFVDRQS